MAGTNIKHRLEMHPQKQEVKLALQGQKPINKREQGMLEEEETVLH